MRALRAVEHEGVGVGARGGRVRCGVGNLRGLAVAACVYGVDGVQDEGRGGGEEDVALRGGLAGACGRGGE